jgi:Tfp pilus assembly PilM family ATPase
LRTIELPFTGSDSIKKVVKSEIEGEIFTHSVDDMVVDFHEVGPVSSGGTKVMVASVPKVGLRDQLEAFEGRRIDPEQIDLDTMALWRVADWCGAFEADDDAADQSDDADGKPVNAVIDLGARSVKVILTEGSHLVEMRVLRFGDSSVAESVARAHGLDLEQSRLACAESLRSGDDVHVDGSDDVLALVDDDESQEGQASDSAEGEKAEVDTTTPSSELVTYKEIDEANAKYLKRLSRELTRFLTASGMASRIRSLWISGPASRGAGVAKELEAVFGIAAKELDVLSRLAHDLDEDEATERSPSLAIAVGLALGQLGGPEGFQLRQEELVQSGGFDRIKFPLAIACMAALLAVFVFANQKLTKLKVLELEIGLTHNYPDRPEAASFHGQLNTLFQGRWFQDKSYFAVTRGKQVVYSYRDLVKDLKSRPVAGRVRFVRDKLRQVAAQKQKESGVYEDIALESGLAVLVRWAEVLKGIEPELGRYLIATIDLDMKSRKLTFTASFRGEDFRARQSVLERAFTLEMGKPDSPFTMPDRGAFAGTSTLFRDSSDTSVPGAHIQFVVNIKDTFQPFGPSARIGALLPSDKLFEPARKYLAMNTPVVSSKSVEEIR